MPGRNIYKVYVADSYYHVYNRGIDMQDIFREDVDYSAFTGLLKRYLSSEVSKNSLGTAYPTYYEQVELLAYCLMPNHFHLLIYQHDKNGMKRLLKSLGVAYSMYFNKKYHRMGPVFQQRYRASLISSDTYLTNISRYIHLNPSDRSWEWSSLPYYEHQKTNDWLKPERILELLMVTTVSSSTTIRIDETSWRL